MPLKDDEFDTDFMKENEIPSLSEIAKRRAIGVR